MFVGQNYLFQGGVNATLILLGVASTAVQKAISLKHSSVTTAANHLMLRCGCLQGALQYGFGLDVDKRDDKDS